MGLAIGLREFPSSDKGGVVFGDEFVEGEGREGFVGGGESPAGAGPDEEGVCAREDLCARGEVKGVGQILQGAAVEFRDGHRGV